VGILFVPASLICSNFFEKQLPTVFEIMKNTIHVVLISTQTIPNITPILDQRYKPDEVIMLVSKSMQRQADQLEKIYTPRGIKVGRWPIDDAWDIEHIRGRVMTLLNEYKESNVVLNVTCGTKPMSIATYEVFREFEKPIFYVHAERDRLIWMYPKDQPSADLADRIKLSEYLQAYGASHVNQGSKGRVEPHYRDLINELIENISIYSEVLSSLNYYASSAKRNNLRSPTIVAKDYKKPVFLQLVELFEQAGFLSQKNAQLQFADEASRVFVSGGWLEVYAYACCLDLKNSLKIHDLARSVEITRRNGTQFVLNEMDVAFLKDNRLYSIECKTKQFKVSNRKHDDAAEVLYKLDSLRDLLGGLHSKAMLVSFKPIKGHNRDRAAELNIETCCHQNLRFLQEKIADWVD